MTKTKNSEQKDKKNAGELIELIKAGGDLKEVLEWINKNPDADFNSIDKFGDSASHAAVYNQDSDVLKTLIKNKADINRVTSKNIVSPLMLAASTLNIEIFLILIEAGGNVNQLKVDKEGKTEDLKDIVSSIYKLSKAKEPFLKTTMDIIDFYQTASKDVLNILESTQDLVKLQASINLIQDRIIPSNITFSSTDKKGKTTQYITPQIDIWTTPLNHEGTNALKYLFNSNDLSIKEIINIYNSLKEILTDKIKSDPAGIVINYIDLKDLAKTAEKLKNPKNSPKNSTGTQVTKDSKNQTYGEKS